MGAESLLWRLAATAAALGGILFLIAGLNLLRRTVLLRAFRFRQPRPVQGGHILRNYANVEQKLAESRFYPTMAKVFFVLGGVCEIAALSLLVAWLVA